MAAAILRCGGRAQTPGCAPALQPGKRFLGLARRLQEAKPKRRHPRAAPGPLITEANELNKWADRGGQDDDCAFDQFDRDTAALVLRVLTAKATQRLLVQLQELDLFKAQWLNNYCAANSPGEGNKFLMRLFKEPSVVVNDPSTQTDHTIDPSNLAHRIIELRRDMADTMLQFPKYVEVENTAVMRTHIEGMYTSGSSGSSYGNRRGYRRR